MCLRVHLLVSERSHGPTNMDVDAFLFEKYSWGDIGTGYRVEVGVGGCSDGSVAGCMQGTGHIILLKVQTVPSRNIVLLTPRRTVNDAGSSYAHIWSKLKPPSQKS